ncbi:hypothetical protein ACA910_004430 [Epithemia clementina (nom. ined.)]
MPPYSANQLMAASIMAKCSGGLSIVGSSSILVDILWCRKQQQRRQHRLIKCPILLHILLGMSLFDICSSSMYVVGSWAIPPNDHNNNNDLDGNDHHQQQHGSSVVFQPKGTAATCAAQGALFQAFEPAMPLYNLSLALYYYLTIVYNWKTHQLQRFAWAFHMGPILFGTSTAIYGVVTDRFHNSNDLWCWFAGDTRQSKLLIFVLSYVPLWSVFGIVLVLFALIYRHVRQQERANARYRFERNVALGLTTTTNTNTTTTNTNTNTTAAAAVSTAGEPTPPQPSEASPPEEGAVAGRSSGDGDGGSRKSHHLSIPSRVIRAVWRRPNNHHDAPAAAAPASSRLSNPVFWQGLWFSLAFVLTYLLPTIVRFQQAHEDTVKFGLVFAMTLFAPLQGFWNSLVYFRRQIAALFWRPLRQRQRQHRRRGCLGWWWWSNEPPGPRHFQATTSTSTTASPIVSAAPTTTWPPQPSKVGSDGSTDKAVTDSNNTFWGTETSTASSSTSTTAAVATREEVVLTSPSYNAVVSLTSIMVDTFNLKDKNSGMTAELSAVMEGGGGGGGQEDSRQASSSLCIEAAKPTET